LKTPSNLDGLQELLREESSTHLSKSNDIDAYSIIQNLERLTLQKQTPSETAQDNLKALSKVETAVSTCVSAKDTNVALQKLCREKDYPSAVKMISLMESSSIRLTVPSYTAAINMYIDQGKVKEASNVIDMAMTSPKVIPDVALWNTVIAVKAKNDPTEALELVNTTLQSSGINPTIDMMNSILNEYVKLKKNDDVKLLWRRMHCECDLNLESFHIILNHCAKLGEAERAFFYYDELKSRKLSPTIDTYINLIEAAAVAPFWENGFQDMIFDAMSFFEGSEIPPTIEIYNSVIHAFARASDGVAAEFYFWEMQRKGFVPDRYTYQCLFQAYARNSSVNVPDYGYRGRYVRPLERKLTNDEQAFADVGPDRSIKICKLPSCSI
jgi:pentatricopeptide repeat protein